MLFHVKIETSHDSDIRSAEKTAWRRPCCRRSAGGSGALGNAAHWNVSSQTRTAWIGGGKAISAVSYDSAHKQKHTLK